MPGPQDPEKFSFWVRSMLAFAEFLMMAYWLMQYIYFIIIFLQLANLISLRPSDRLDTLRLRDTREVKLFRL
jgi:hypothetical protein